MKAVRFTPAVVVLSLFLIVACLAHAQCAIIRVKTDGIDTNDGSSWTLAKKTVQAALTASVSGGEVWVKAGTYVQCITLKAGVGLYGGFAGTESIRGERNWKTNVTTLDGASGGSSVVTAPSGVTPSTVVDGFTICNGRGTGVDNGWGYTYYGGGIYCNSASPTISNNTITRNTADMFGGIYCSSSSSIISGNNITSNTGGGIMATNSTIVSGNLILLNGSYGIYASGSCTITNNTVVADGCGVCCYNSSPSISNNIIALGYQGVASSGGGSPTLRNNCVYGNTAGNYIGLSAGTGDINTDPVFADSAYGNLHIQPTSPCIGAGWNGAAWIPSADVDSQSRVQPSGGVVDIGVDESDGTTWAQGPYAVVRVGPTGSDANDGSTWAQAKCTVQAALDCATLQGGDVWVAAGSYKEQITLPAHAYLYGGFGGTETTAAERNWKTNASVLDGCQVAVTVRAKQCGIWSAIDGFTITNGLGGIWCTGASPRIANNRIIGNVKAAGTGTTGYGGGIYAEGTHCTITGNLIIGNSVYGHNGGYGGGIYCSSGDATITNNTIAFNNAQTQGGGIGFSSNAVTSVSNNIIYSNNSGVYSAGGTQTLRNNCVYGNAAYNYSGLSAGVGDISLDPVLADPTFGDFHIQPGSPCVSGGWNDAPSLPAVDMDLQARVQPGGGAVDIGVDESDGSAWPVGPRSVVRVSTFGDDANDGSTWGFAKRTVQAAVDAASAVGGEVWVKSGTYNEHVNARPFAYLYGGFSGSETLLSQRDFSANRSVLDAQGAGSVITACGCVNWTRIDGFTLRNGQAGYGGGINCSNSVPVIVNNRIETNRAGINGGAVYCGYGSTLLANNVIVGNWASNRASALYCDEKSSPVAVNNTIVYNQCDNGAVYVYSGLTFSNNTVALNSSGIYKYSPATPVLRNNNVYMNTKFNYLLISAGQGDISLDPKFADALYGNFHIQATSPCRDAGYDAGAQIGWVDMDGQSRIQGSHVDIGADESNGTTWAAGPYAVVRVAPTGNDNNDGSTWALSKRTIQAAANAVSPVGGDVWVKSGLYNETVDISGACCLYGGFDGTESRRTQRDWNANPTIVDGQGVDAVVSFKCGFGASGALDGFTIRNGMRGVMCEYASPTITNNIITSNSVTGTLNDGGGLVLGCSNSKVTCNSVIGNTTQARGGGVYSSGGSPFFGSNLIVNNTSGGQGGGMYLSYGNPDVDSNTIVGNSSPGAGCAVTCYETLAGVTGNIIAYNSSGIHAGGTVGTPYNSKNDVFSNGTQNYSGWFSNSSDISADPLFVNRSAGDYHLKPQSPCIDCGANSISVDRDGRLRPQDGDGIGGYSTDMGAYEIPLNVAKAKKTYSSGIVYFDGASVTATFSALGYVYVESLERSWGIRVKTTEALSEGMVVIVQGEMRTDSVDGERYVDAYYGMPRQVIDKIYMPEPFFLTTASLGGCSLGLQQGVTGALGPNNFGLLVTISGKVVQKDSAVPARWFKVDDGCGVNAKVVVPSGVTDLPNVGQQVAVTGISSCEKPGADVLRLLRVRKQADIRKF